MKVQDQVHTFILGLYFNVKKNAFIHSIHTLYGRSIVVPVSLGPPSLKGQSALIGQLSQA